MKSYKVTEHSVHNVQDNLKNALICTQIESSEKSMLEPEDSQGNSLLKYSISPLHLEN
jgi:hypothetical protein